MSVIKKMWRKGRGKLGLLEPLLGSWQSDADTPLGSLRCTRIFSRVLGGNYIILEARWNLPNKIYEEHSVYGIGSSGVLAFWSFTSAGQHSQGILTDGTDIHPEAIAFEAEMPAGTARMVYWPLDGGGFNWVVESKTKKGWNRFTEHRYFEQPK